MNRRIVLGTLVAMGLGIGLFSAGERALRGAVPAVPAPPDRVPEAPVELVTLPPRPAPVRVAPAPAGMMAAAVARAVSGEPVPVAARQAEAPPAGVGVQVDRLTICSAVRDKEPSDSLGRVAGKAGKVYAWMKVTNAKGCRVRPVWTLNGRKSTGSWVTIPAATPYRTWAMKRIDASMAGSAKVEIQDEQGRVLATKAFEITKK
ncbi:MAG: DUF2914 domain-containing protein [Candidatus Brocadiae bacterium]|nr:DUF2914 domain-containing protein [Candidatus Brocadiia bacterium]